MKLVCPNCGNRLTTERSKYFRKQKKEYVENNHYRCQVCALNKRKSIMVSEKRMEKAFSCYIKSFNTKAMPEAPEKDEDKEKKKLLNQLIKIEKQREKYQRAWSSDLITDDEFSDRMKETKGKKEEVQAELDKIQPVKEIIDIEKVKSIISNFNMNWSYLSPIEKRDFMSEFVESVHFHKIGVDAEITDVHFY